VDARTLDEAEGLLQRRRRCGFESLALFVLCCVLAPFAFLASELLGLAVAVGAGFETLRALVAIGSRRALIGRLALELDAYAIPAVRAYGSRLVRPRQRMLLAQGIRKMLAEAFRPDSLYIGERVARYTRELEAIARDLLTPGVRFHPASIARCRRLMTEAAESPLYNDRLPAEDIGFVLRRIRAGIQRED
jgi:hypothetical protein